jgi:hypothetical protein
MNKIIACLAILVAYSHTASAALGRTLQQTPGGEETQKALNANEDSG